jgi:hypothetical protein
MRTLTTIQPRLPDTTISHIKCGGRGGSDQEDDGCGGMMAAVAGEMATTGVGRVTITKRMA